MIHAINKSGREAYFTERVWDMLPKNKNGWVEFSAQGEVLVPQQVIEFQQKKKAVAVVDENTETQIEPEVVVKKVAEPKKANVKTKVKTTVKRAKK